ESLAGLVERAGTPMLQTALVTLEGWINALPPATIRSRPGLISLRGAISAMKGNLPEANALLDMAIEAYKRDGNRNDLALALVRRAHTLRLLGKYTHAIKDVDEALQIAEADSFLRPLYAEALRVRGLVSYRLGQSRSAIEDIERSLHIYRELKETASIPMVLAETAMIHAAIGNVNVAKNLYQEALVWLREEKNLFTEADTLNNLAVLYLQLGEYELASDTFEQGLGSAQKSGNQHAESLILAGLGDLYTEIEEYDVALQAYERAKLAAGETIGAFLSNYLILAQANLAILKNDAQLASQYLRQFKRKLKINPSVYERGFWSLLEGKRSFLISEYKKAVSLLREAKSCFLQDGRESEYQWCVIWLTAAYEQAGERESARVEFQELLTAKNKTNHSLVIALHQASPWLITLQTDEEIGRGLGGLLQKEQQLSARLSSVRRILRRHAQFVQMPAPGLKVHALGRGEVSVNGRAVNISDWRVQSARDLFFFFLNKQEGMSKEQIGHELWPEIEDERVLKTRFKQDIYRLRKAVGRNVIVFEEENYRYNRDIDYEYDVDAFESYINRARHAQDAAEQIGYYQKAIDLYGGHYLSDVNDDWVLIERERLKIVYISALEDLARLHLEANQLLECLEICKLAIAQDRYNETIYGLELRAYAAQGDRASVARRYAEYKEIMEQELGLIPSAEMERVYRELTI
ncbi:MAG: tetratricopeptide repeat protein, partial [Anaerolineae bacterium]|nr:tetratricopeptide repeat protein [Anaerolineae bacterium]